VTQCSISSSTRLTEYTAAAAAADDDENDGDDDNDNGNVDFAADSCVTEFRNRSVDGAMGSGAHVSAR